MNRVAAVWMPDWPAVAAAGSAGVRPAEPLAVMDRERVWACSAAARTAGVGRGLRRREAQARCPGLVLVPRDDDRDGGAFEPVVEGVRSVAAGIEVMRPGLLVVSMRGPARFHGSEDIAAERIIDAAGIEGVDVSVGVADVLTTAILAARHGTVVAPGGDGAFLAPLPVGELLVERALGMCTEEGEEAVGLLRRLGVRTLGDLAELERARLVARFGWDAGRAHDIASGGPGREPAPPPPGRDLSVLRRCDPPLERVDAAAFLARGLAESFHARLAEVGVACSRFSVRATTGAGEEHVRVWRCVEPLAPRETADRVRWQLDGWLTRGRLDASVAPSAGIVELCLEPVEVVPAGVLQRGLWGGVGESEERSRRVVSRVQALLGPDAVVRPVPSGGRSPGEQVAWVTAGEESATAGPDGGDAPWPGRLPAPLPSVLPRAIHVELLDRGGRPVGVTGRGLVTGEPVRLRECATGGAGGTRPIEGWAGPWAVDERWWIPEGADRGPRREAWVQVWPEGGEALLLATRPGGWEVVGIYR